MPILALNFTISTALAPLPTPEYVPANDEAYTLYHEVDGYRNGSMPDDRLMSFDGCTLERDAAYMYALLMEAAEEVLDRTMAFANRNLGSGGHWRPYWVARYAELLTARRRFPP